MIPAMISNIPITFGAVTVSWKSKALKMKTSTNDKLINGYAKLNSSFVIAAIQQRPAKNAASIPVRTHGSVNNPVKNRTFFANSPGKGPARFTRHFTTNCEHAVSTTEQKTNAIEL